jgi:hypothetical protein
LLSSQPEYNLLLGKKKAVHVGENSALFCGLWIVTAQQRLYIKEARFRGFLKKEYLT